MNSERRLRVLANETLRLKEKGLNPLPIRGGTEEVSKRPFLKQGELINLYDNECTAEDIRTWVRRHRASSVRSSTWQWMNLGLVTGHTSGLFVVDVDDDSAWYYLELLGVERDHPTWRWSTGRGTQLAFSLPEKVPVSQFAGNGRLLPDAPFDIKGERGYVVVPPSVHRSGRLYAYDEGCDIDEVPLASPPPLLVETIRRVNEEKVA